MKTVKIIKQGSMAEGCATVFHLKIGDILEVKDSTAERMVELGFGTLSIGRGDRSSKYIVDELAFIEEEENVEKSDDPVKENKSLDPVKENKSTEPKKRRGRPPKNS